MASLVLLQPLSTLSSSSSATIIFHRNPQNASSLSLLKPISSKRLLLLSRPLTVPFALTESDSPKSIEPDPQTLLKELADSFDLPQGYFKQLPSDLRKDLDDAAFDLSNGQVLDQCGQELGEILLNLSRAWEKADTSTSLTLARKLPLLVGSLSENAKSALGNRLLSAGRRFQFMGQYGQGELQKIANAMIATGELLSASSTSEATDEKSKSKVETRILKYGNLQVEITPDNANIGAVIGVAFGFLSSKLGDSVRSIPESDLQYANDNALLLGKSLRLALLSICYSSAVLSVFAAAGLVLLGMELRSKNE